MPAKAQWLGRVPELLGIVQASTETWVDRRAIQTLFDVSPRQALNLMQSIGSVEYVGTSAVVAREALIMFLEVQGAVEIAEERKRQRKFAETLGKLQKDRIEKPALLVELPKADVQRIARKDFNGLPENIQLEPGRLLLEFASPKECLELLAQFAVAVASAEEEFIKRASLPEKGKAAS